MLATPHPRQVTLLSTFDTPGRQVMLTNLCASLAHLGSDTLLIDGRRFPRLASHMGLPRRASLLDVISGHSHLADAVQSLEAGFALATLNNGRQSAFSHLGHLSVLEALSTRFSTVLIDAELDEQDQLPIAELEQSQIVVQVSADAESIKAGYALIKRLHRSLGQIQCGVLVTGAEEHRARLIYANLAQTARRYLAVSLNDMGSIPSDDHLGRAARLGRAVIDAFPLALASVAFRRVAGQLSII